jgi:hypothetical protein
MLATISQGVHVARRRCGCCEVVAFLAVLFGSALSGERTLEAFSTTVRLFAPTFMAVFGRVSVPTASTLSRF